MASIDETDEESSSESSTSTPRETTKGDALSQWGDDETMTTKLSLGAYSFLHHHRDSMSMIDHGFVSFPQHHTPDELLLMEVQVHTATNVAQPDERNEDNWGLLDDSLGNHNEGGFDQLASSFHGHATPQSNRSSCFESPVTASTNRPVCVVSPSPSLHLQLQRAKSRFALSMKRSEQTRWMVQRMNHRRNPSQQMEYESVRKRMYEFITEDLRKGSGTEVHGDPAPDPTYS